MGSTGIANTMDLSARGGFAYSLEKLWQLPASAAALVFAAVRGGAAGGRLSGQPSQKTPEAGRSARRDCRSCRRDAAPRDEGAVLHGQRCRWHVRRGGAALPVNVVIMRTGSASGNSARSAKTAWSLARRALTWIPRTHHRHRVLHDPRGLGSQLIFVQNMGSLQTSGAHEQGQRCTRARRFWSAALP